MTEDGTVSGKLGLQNPTKILLKIRAAQGRFSYMQMVVAVGNDVVVGESVVMRSLASLGNPGSSGLAFDHRHHAQSFQPLRNGDK